MTTSLKEFDGADQCSKLAEWYPALPLVEG